MSGRVPSCLPKCGEPWWCFTSFFTMRNRRGGYVAALVSMPAVWAWARACKQVQSACFSAFDVDGVCSSGLFALLACVLCRRMLSWRKCCILFTTPLADRAARYNVLRLPCIRHATMPLRMVRSMTLLGAEAKAVLLCRGRRYSLSVGPDLSSWVDC